MATTVAEYLRQEGESTLLISLLEFKFKNIPESYRQRISKAKSESLLKWGRKILMSETLEDAFRS